MKRIFTGKNAAKYGPVLLSALLLAALLLMPTGFEDKEVYTESDLSPALVLSVDDSKIVDTGLVRSGDQLCRLRILSGPSLRGRRLRETTPSTVRLNRTSSLPPGTRPWCA